MMKKLDVKTPDLSSGQVTNPYLLDDIVVKDLNFDLVQNTHINIDTYHMKSERFPLISRLVFYNAAVMASSLMSFFISLVLVGHYDKLLWLKYVSLSLAILFVLSLVNIFILAVIERILEKRKHVQSNDEEIVAARKRVIKDDHSVIHLEQKGLLFLFICENAYRVYNIITEDSFNEKSVFQQLLEHKMLTQLVFDGRDMPKKSVFNKNFPHSKKNYVLNERIRNIIVNDDGLFQKLSNELNSSDYVIKSTICNNDIENELIWFLDFIDVINEKRHYDVQKKLLYKGARYEWYKEHYMNMRR